MEIILLKIIILNFKEMIKSVLIFICVLLPIIGNAQQSLVIKGIVTESKTGEPVVGATLQAKTSGVATITDLDGRYELQDVSGEEVLIVKFLGMKPLEVMVNNRTHINIQLEDELQLVGEVVVAGYGVQKKSDLTGALSSVKKDQLLTVPTTDIGKMLTGRVAGLDVISADGRPGSTSQIRIRGTRSLSGGNDPLYILDGVPIEDMSVVNPQDIKSVEVLKDAASTAIYGARAANGVVLITTQRGQKGQTNINFSTTQSVQQLKRNFDFFSPEEYIALQREIYRNSDGSYPSNDVVFNTWEQDNLLNKRYTDWEDLTISDACLSRYDLSVSSGNDRSSMLLSAGYFKQSGMISNSGYEQFNSRLNYDYDIFDNLSVGANVSLSFADKDTEEEFIEGYLSLSPLTSPYGEDGNLIPVAGDGAQANPLWNNREYSDNDKKYQYLLNVFGDWTIVGGLKYRLNLSLNSSNNERQVYRSSKHQIGSNTNGTGNISKGSNRDFLVENIVDYRLEKKELGSINLTLVQSANHVRSEILSVGATQFSSDLFGAGGIGGALAPGQPSYRVSDRKILSYMGRANFSVLNKYMASFTIRADGSSVFGKNNKWAYLPSASLAWLMHHEEFLQGQDWLSNLKLRLSYGAVGNQAVAPYQTLGVVSDYFYKFGDNEPSYSALPSGVLYNPNLKWEVSESYNAGLDLGFFDNRLTLTTELYQTRTKDLIVSKSLNSSLGYTRMYDNLGQVDNKGIELTLHYDVLRESNLKWGVDMTFAKNKNEIVKISGEIDVDGKPVDDVNNNWFIGKPISVYYDYQFAGIWQIGEDPKGSHMPTAKPGDIKIVDQDDNLKVDSNDKIIYQKDPKFVASFTSSMQYKGFDLNLDFYWRYGGYRLNGLYGSALSGGGSNGMKVAYWTPENPINHMPKPSQNYISYTSTLQYQSATFFRLRNVTLGYTLSSNLLAKVKVKNMRIYGSLSNFFTVTDFLSYGPEHSGGSYPEPKTAEIGLNLTF